MNQIDIADDAESGGSHRELGVIAPDLAARLITVAADVALVVDSDGIVRDAAFGGDGRLGAEFDNWVGRPFVDVVSPDSRIKASELLRDAVPGRESRLREINHPSTAKGETVPIRYSAVRDGMGDRVFVIGRDLRTVAALEQRLTTTQQAMEQEYSRLRAADTRYRVLFHLTAEPVLIADASSRRVMEANPAAIAALSATGRVNGRSLTHFFDSASGESLLGMLAQASATGEATGARLRAAENQKEFDVRVSLFRQEGAAFLLVRLGAPEAERVTSGPSGTPALVTILNRLPDALVATDVNGIVLDTNPAFLDLTQVATIDQVRGQPLDRWLGRPGIDYGTLTAMLSEYGYVRGFTTIIRSAYGSSDEAEVSAVSVKGELPCFGFLIRGVVRPREREQRLRASMPRSVEQLTELVGRVPLKELVRETTDIIERLCIEAALDMTGDNRASAAEMLGLSRQSLYAKLHRFGLGDLSSSDDN